MELGEVNKDFRPPADTPPKVKYFEPKPDGKDRFGNTILQYSRLKDEGVDPVATVALVSPEGRNFIQENPSITTLVEDGVDALRKEVPPEVKKIELQDGAGTLEYLGAGQESDVFLLDQKGKKKIVKTSRTKEGAKADDVQSHMSEMLMTQNLSEEFAKDMRRHKTALQTYLLATDNMSIVEYAGDEVPTQEEIDASVGKMILKIKRHIDKQKKQKNPLWENIFLDVGIMTARTGEEYPSIVRSECRKTADGVTIWVDPFVSDVDVFKIHGKLKGPRYNYET